MDLGDRTWVSQFFLKIDCKILTNSIQSGEFWMQPWTGLLMVLLASMEAFQWFNHRALPLPIFILAGLGLAIATNLNKRLGLPSISNRLGKEVINSVSPFSTSSSPSHVHSASSIPVSPTPSSPLKGTTPTGEIPSVDQPSKPVLPSFQSDCKPVRQSISFPIRRSD